MNDENLIDDLQSGGHVTEQQVSRWRDAAVLMAVLEAIGRDGASVVVKIDGGRPDAVYTVVISDPQLGELFFRKDGPDAVVLLREAVEFYRRAAWSS